LVSARTTAETRLLKLYAVLIGNFEQSRYSLGAAAPAREILSGKRCISRELARKSGDFFGVRPSCFF
jgi:hypothetical protein